MALTSKQRAALRSAANTIDPVFQIGKGEIDDTLIQGLADCIAARELIKIKVLENSEYSAREAADTLCRICWPWPRWWWKAAKRGTNPLCRRPLPT